MIKRSSHRKGEIVAMRQSAYWSASVARNLTPGRLTRILTNLDSGDISDEMVFFDDIVEIELHLGAVTQIRLLAAASQDTGISDAPGAATEQDRVHPGR